MSERDDRVSLVDMLVHATEAVDPLGRAGREDLESDRVMQLALTRLMEIVGEAASRVSEQPGSITRRFLGVGLSERATGWLTATMSLTSTFSGTLFEMTCLL